MSAVISSCGQYRYLLERPTANCTPEVLFVMLNPSTADGVKDDATIRRCKRFAASWGYRGIRVVNLFALRSREPRALLDHQDPVGPENDSYIANAAAEAKLTICAWGGFSWVPRARRDWIQGRSRDVIDRLVQNGCPKVLGLVAGLSPRHPLYVRADVRPQDWT